MYILAQEAFNVNNIALLAVVGGVVAAWNQIRGMFQGFISFFIRTDKIDIVGQKRMKIFLDLFMKKSKKVKWGNVHYCHEDAVIFNYNNAPEFYGGFYFIAKQKWLVMYKGFIPVFINFEDADSIKMTYLFMTFPIKKIMNEFAKIILTIDSAKNLVQDENQFYSAGYFFEEVVGNSNFAFTPDKNGGQ